MVFSSPIFIFLFLPLVLAIYYLLPWRFKNYFLLSSSLFFYFFGERFYLIIMLLMIVINYLFGLAVAKKGLVSRNLMVGVCVAVNLAMLGYFKYTFFFVAIFNDLFGFVGCPLPVVNSIHLPIGISFFTFQALSYVIDVYRGEVTPQRNPATLALYISLFPQLIAGPIVRYADVFKELNYRKHHWSDLAYGIERFIFGLAKKVLIANSIAYYVDKIFAIPDAELSSQLAWLGVVGYALQIYFDFSAYSDMAIGLGRMFGLKFLENFNHPYTASSIQDFWRRWHISLSTWFRDYLYIPLGGNRLGLGRTYVNLLIVFFLTGLWHGASYNFIIWGLLHGAFLILERAGFSKVLSRLPALLRHSYAVLVVLIGWVFFRATNLSQAFSLLSTMFSFKSSPEAIAHFAFLIDTHFMAVLVIGIILSTPVRQYLFSKSSFNNPLATGAKRFVYTVIMLITFTISIVYLAAGTYNPFIYFRF